jgi:hypothetical protein
MLPTLRHIPPRALTRIPGPPSIGSRRSLVDLGVLGAIGLGGVPTASMISSYIAANSGSPVWFAVSDGGQGYIPWGSWQVAFYATGAPLPPSNLAFLPLNVPASGSSAAIGGQLWNAFKVLQASGVAGGYPSAAQILISLSDLQDPLGPTPAYGVLVTAPFGVSLQGFYIGPTYQDGEGPELPMLRVDAGYDNPLLLALWGPGNRAILRAVEGSGPARYPGYPYPEPPPSLSPEARQFVDRLVAPISGAETAQYAAVIDALVAQGAWAKLDGLYIHGPQNDANIVVNLKSATPNASFVNSSKFTFLPGYGLVGAAAGNCPNVSYAPFMNTNFNAATAGGHYVRDNASAGVGVRTPGEDSGDAFGLLAGSNVVLTPNYPAAGLVTLLNGGAPYGEAVTSGAHLLTAVRSSSTQLKTYVDTTLKATSPSVSTALASSPFCFFRGETNSIFGGAVGYGYFGTDLTVADIGAIHSAMATFQAAQPPRPQKMLCFEGDSITAGNAATTSWAWNYRATNPANTFVLQRAVSGSTLVTLNSRLPNLQHYFTLVNGLKVAVILVGCNDWAVLATPAATFLTNIATYYDAVRAAGADKVIGCTCTPNNDVGFNTWRGIVNPGLRAMVGTHLDAIIDFAANATMGTDAAGTNGALYNQPSGEHPTDVGHGNLEAIAAAVLAAYF